MSWALVHNQLRSLCCIGSPLCFSQTGKPRTGPAHQGFSHQCWVRDEEPHSSACRWHSPNTAQQSLPTSTPRFLSAELLPCQSVFSHREELHSHWKGSKLLTALSEGRARDPSHPFKHSWALNVNFNWKPIFPFPQPWEMEQSIQT